MKKLSLLLLTIFLLQALTGCLPSGIPSESQLSTSPSTDPIQSSEATDPSTQPSTGSATEPSTEPQETQPLYYDLMVFIFKGDQPTPGVTVDISQCQVDHLYYYHEITGETVPICDEPVSCFTHNLTAFYFVKKAEPNTLYTMPLTGSTEHTAIYTSDFGPLNDIFTMPFIAYQKVVTMIENDTRGVMLNLATGETEVFIEQYYLQTVQIADLMEKDGKFTYNKIMFLGKLNESDTLKDYFYWIDSDTITINEC